MDNILTKKILTKINGYLSSPTDMTRPERRCLKDMVTGILKSRSVFVNQIAASLREPLKLKDVAKRLSAQYLKEGYADKALEGHLGTVAPGVSKDDFIVMDGTDISKKHAKYMEGLEFVRNGDTGGIGLGYNVLNINAVSAHKEISPLLSRAYSFEMGALSSNNEIKKAVREVKGHLGENGCWVFDRGADNGILKDFFIGECPRAILRLKKNTKVDHNGEKVEVRELAKKVGLSIGQKVVKVKKNRPVVEIYDIGAVPIEYRIGRTVHHLWLVVSRNRRHGGYCYLLVKSDKSTAMEVAKWAFKGYGLRWKIEEYHRHVKQEYGLEDIQIRTFTGLQSMLAVLTVAMYMIYRKIRSMHIDLLLDAGYNYLNKNVPRELVNFIYYKISKVVSILLMPVRTRWKLDDAVPDPFPGQLDLKFN
jgi:hypothetical protein